MEQVEQYPGAMLNFMENGEVTLTGMMNADVPRKLVF